MKKSKHRPARTEGRRAKLATRLKAGRRERKFNRDYGAPDIQETEKPEEQHDPRQSDQGAGDPVSGADG